ncbi:hypothetical protein LQ953_00760 [Sphingomonas sp. IC-56]|uniref:hypothetical protein n=1 Tax=Sphingomonas sp. IC-56 TaxID=2898529 RepID=UPI001967A15D|nr:hypothetical protein [Sphingomonas sp. IC-56]MBN2971259.1 hypothetical protein [Roseomonas aeriglobus]MCD2322543.1 hypothetical protein [Sphingomonas sp. IC-56]
MDLDLDAALRRVADDEHPGLRSIEAAVFNRVRANRTSARTGIGAVAFAAVGAIMLGTMTAGSAASPASAAPIDPFGVASPLAPSTLLLADR